MLDIIKQKFKHKYGFVETGDGCFENDFCLVEFVLGGVKLTHPVTKTQYEVSNELIFSETQSIEYFLSMMLGEDRVNEEVACRVFNEEGWRQIGVGSRGQHFWTRGDITLSQHNFWVRADKTLDQRSNTIVVNPRLCSHAPTFTTLHLPWNILNLDPHYI